MNRSAHPQHPAEKRVCVLGALLHGRRRRLTGRAGACSWRGEEERTRGRGREDAHLFVRCWEKVREAYREVIVSKFMTTNEFISVQGGSCLFGLGLLRDARHNF